MSVTPTHESFDTYFDRQMRNPKFARAYRRAEERQARLVERVCREGNCVEFYDPWTGRSDGGWGPVGCPCEDHDPPTVNRAEYDRRRRQR